MTSNMPDNLQAKGPDSSSSSSTSHNCLTLWTNIPSEEGEEFQKVIGRNINEPEVHGSEGHDPKIEKSANNVPPAQSHDPKIGKSAIYVPPDESLAVWTSSPNKDQNASFGANGTTASVTCEGDLIQMTSFLGAGRSGVFAMDQTDTDEPYYVWGRVWDFIYKRYYLRPFLIKVPDEYLSPEPPDVKWVSWKWPRFDYPPSANGVQVSIQYMVHNDVVLQQIVITNESQKPVDIELYYKLPPELVIRDLDFVKPQYKFNERDSASRRYALGPCGYGHVIVNPFVDEFDHIRPEGKPAAGTSPQHGPSEKAPHGGSGEPEQTVKGHRKSPSSSQVNIHAIHAPPDENKATPKQDKQTRPSQAKHVASVITMFVDGVAEKMVDHTGSKDIKDGVAKEMEHPSKENWPTKPLARILPAKDRTLPAKGEAEEAEAAKFKRQRQLEIVVAYKLLLLSEAGNREWKDFIVSAEEANINNHLHTETTAFWKDQTPLSALSLPGGNPQESSQSSHPSNISIRVIDPQNITTQNTEATVATHDGGALPRGSVQHLHLSPASDNSSMQNAGPQSNNSRLPIGQLKFPSEQAGAFFEYLAWRHLEHVLSVCAMPICDSKASGAKPPTIYTALTCGDISGHRITTSASFFAFTFLVDMARRLTIHKNKAESTHPYVENLLKRIDDVCHGHIKWLKWIQETERVLPSRCFAANYWVTGQIIPKDDGSSYQPDNSVTDTAFQILKVTQFFEFLTEQGLDKEVVRKLYIPLPKVHARWLIELDRIDPRAFSAWPRTRNAGINKFRLEDHFWIWKSLESLEKSRATSNPTARWKSGSDVDLESELVQITDDPIKDWKLVIENLSSSRVQRNILQRFTTENDIVGRRMLALTRTLAESRFVLHGRDNALLRLGFFSNKAGNSYKELWRRTINVQHFYEGNDRNNWAKSLHYALGITVGSSEFLDASSSENPVVECTETLINSSGHNGFFPGLLDEGTKDPVAFAIDEERDLYFHAGFEIHCLLLQYASGLIEKFGSTIATTNKTAAANTSITTKGDIDTLLKELSPKISELNKAIRMNSPGFLSEVAETGVNIPRNIVMRKFIPTGSPVDSTNIALIDDEWLYDRPSFFTVESRFTNKHKLKRYLPSLMKGASDNLGKVIGGVIDRILKVRPSDTIASDTIPSDTIAVWDAPKQKRHGKRDSQWVEPKQYHFDTDDELIAKLEESRTPENAKKRFIWLPNANPYSALISWSCTADVAERISLSQFFDSNLEYNKAVVDGTNRVFNTWKTELHLSFHFMAPEQMKPRNALTAAILAPKLDQSLLRASMSFRFDGDFFDRFWTCHVVDRVPESHPTISADMAHSPDELPRLTKLPDPGQLDEKELSNASYKPQWQRKVLEVSLVCRILGLIVKESNAVLDFTQKRLGIDPKDNFLSHIDRVTDLKSTLEWPMLERVLQTMEDDLSSTLEKLKEWDSREKDRGKEQPRWTRNDEKKYRQTITRLQAAYKSQVRQITSTRDQMRKLKDKLAKRRETLQNISEYHGNENIRYFTYVTIIFLPLGFATSFYSMSGPPDLSFLPALVEFAAAAFAVTFFLMFIVKPAARTIRFVAEFFTPTTEAHKLLLGARTNIARRAGRKLAFREDGISSAASASILFGKVLASSIILIVMGLLWTVALVLYNLSDLIKKTYHLMETSPEKLIETLRTFAKENEKGAEGSPIAVSNPNSSALHTPQNGSSVPRTGLERYLLRLVNIPAKSRLRPLASDNEDATSAAGNEGNAIDNTNSYKKDEEQ